MTLPRTTRRLFLAAGSATGVFAALGTAVAKACGADVSLPAKEREELLDAYDEWLFHERQALHIERFGLEASRETRKFVPCTHAHNFHFPCSGEPHPAAASSRAAAVLSAVGCDWRGETIEA